MMVNNNDDSNDIDSSVDNYWIRKATHSLSSSNI